MSLSSAIRIQTSLHRVLMGLVRTPESLVAALIAGTADELMAREAMRLTARQQDWFPVRPARLALQYLVQFPPRMEHPGFQRSDRQSHDASSFFRG